MISPAIPNFLNIPATVSIKPAGLQDVEIISQLARETFYETFKEVVAPENMEPYLAKSFAPAVIAQEIESHLADYYLLQFYQEPVAYAKLRSDRNETYGLPMQAIELERIYILQNYLNHRLGTYLMDFVEQIYKTRGYETMWLTVWEKNDRAQHFYRKRNFTKTRDYDFKVGNAAYRNQIMIKKL